MEALDQFLVGVQVERGGALHAKPDDNVRRRIQVFKRIEAERDYEGDGFGDIEDDLIADSAAEIGREETLERLFAAGRKNGSDSKRPKGFAQWRPQRKTLVVLAQVRDILDEYRAELPLTARQIFYRLVGAYGYPKTESFAKNLNDHLTRARRSKKIPFDAIRDDGISIMDHAHYADENAFYKAEHERARAYKRDKLARQGLDIRVYCEAAGMMPQLERVCEPYSIPSTVAQASIASRRSTNSQRRAGSRLSTGDAGR